MVVSSMRHRMLSQIGRAVLSPALYATFAFLLVGCANNDTQNAVSQHRRFAEKALKTGDYELARQEYGHVLVLLDQEQLREQQKASETGEPVARDAQIIYEAMAAHERAARQYHARKQYDLAAAEYKSLLNLISLAQAREQQMIGAQIQKTSMRETKERNAVNQWLDAQLKKKNLTDNEKAAIHKQYSEKMEAITQKFAQQYEKRQKETERLQNRLKEKTAELCEKRVQVYETISRVYDDKKDKVQAESYRTMARQERVILYQQQSDLAKAEAEYREWLKSDPNAFVAHDGLANLFSSQRKWQEAEQHLRWMVEKNPQDTYSRQRLATALAEQQKWDAAVQQYRVILDLTTERIAKSPATGPQATQIKQSNNAQLASVYLQLGQVLTRAKRTSEAQKAYAKVRALSPEVARQIPAEPAIP